MINNKKSLTLLKWMLMGGSFTDPNNGIEYQLDEDGIPFFEGQREENGRIEKAMLPVDITLSYFIDIANSIPDDEITKMNASIVLTEEKKK